MPYPLCSTYNCKSDPNALTKVYDLVNQDIPITYNFDLGIEDPVLYFSKNIDPNLFNYVWIPSLGRNYWVVSPPTYLDGIYSVQCHVDVLETFKDAIYGLTAIVKRNAKYYNRYLQDDKYKLYQPTATRLLDWGKNKGFKKEVTEFILCVVGNTQEVPPDTLNTHVINTRKLKEVANNGNTSGLS